MEGFFSLLKKGKLLKTMCTTQNRGMTKVAPTVIGVNPTLGSERQDVACD